MSTLNSVILSVTRRTTKGFTVGEIYDRVVTCYLNKETNVPPYNSVRARVYELRDNGKLWENDFRKDSSSGRMASTFVR